MEQFSIVQQCAQILIRPLVLFCLKHSIKIQDIIEWLKLVFVEAAQAELQAKGAKITQSRLSILTGMRRKEILRISQSEEAPKEARNLINKVIGRWQDDKHYTTSGGKPRLLSFGTVASEFSRMVSAVSSDLNPATVLFELERIGAVKRTNKGLSLEVRAYIPKGDAKSILQILAQDVHDLTSAVDQNIQQTQALQHHHLRTEYDRIRPEGIAELKRWFLQEGHALHLRVREKIAQYDQDVNPDPDFKGQGTRVTFGSFSFVESQEDSQKKT
jgi:hypothetical protein